MNFCLTLSLPMPLRRKFSTFLIFSISLCFLFSLLALPAFATEVGLEEVEVEKIENKKVEEEQPFAFGPVAAWQVMAGPTLGAQFGESRGLFLGAEVSLNRLQAGLWRGLYIDGSYGVSPSEGLFTVGPQLGYMLFGFDAGGALRVHQEGISPGARARFHVTVGLLGLYGAYLYFPGSSANHSAQVGVNLKLPVWTASTQ